MWFLKKIEVHYDIRLIYTSEYAFIIWNKWLSFTKVAVVLSPLSILIFTLTTSQKEFIISDQSTYVIG